MTIIFKQKVVVVKVVVISILVVSASYYGYVKITTKRVEATSVQTKQLTTTSVNLQTSALQNSSPDDAVKQFEADLAKQDATNVSVYVPSGWAKENTAAGALSIRKDGNRGVSIIRVKGNSGYDLYRSGVSTNSSAGEHYSSQPVQLLYDGKTLDVREVRRIEGTGPSAITDWTVYIPSAKEKGWYIEMTAFSPVSEFDSYYQTHFLKMAFSIHE